MNDAVLRTSYRNSAEFGLRIGFQSLSIDEHYQVLVCELITSEVGDSTLAQIATSFDTFMGGSVYDGEAVSQVVLDKQPDAQVVIRLGTPSQIKLTVEAKRREARLANIKCRFGAKPQ